jgi:predicted Zn-dependent protease
MRVIVTTAFLALVLTALCSCATQRRAIPIGEIPQASYVSNEEEQYGLAVFAELHKQYPLSKNDDDINRVRSIADRLSRAAGAEQQPWNVYVFAGDRVKNAAATRGNFIFVWTGMLLAAKHDEELATVIAHEMGHVLARHPLPDPGEEANAIIAGSIGTIAQEIVGALPGPYALLANLAGGITKTVLNAAIVNPEQQRKEFEADQIGLFLMADASYHPEAGISFWKRAQEDPDMGPSALAFLSSHPSSDKRLLRLQEILPQALQRYERSLQERRWRNGRSSR